MSKLDKLVHQFTREEFMVPFDRLFDQLYDEILPGYHKFFGIDFMGKQSYPKCDILVKEEELIIELAVPGLKKKQISIKYNPQERLLVITGEKKDQTDKTVGKYIYKELKSSAFRRTFYLSSDLSGDNLKADFKDGMLTISIPRVGGPDVDNSSEIDIPIDEGN